MAQSAAVSSPTTRRRFIATSGHTLGALALGPACGAVSTTANAASAVIDARPRGRVATTLTSGPIGLREGSRDGIVQMPSTARPGPLPVLVFLHGAAGSGAGTLRRMGPAADEAGVVLVAPDSRDGTWDAIRGADFGEDVAFLNRALAFVFARLDVDSARLAIGGFSDGASYALSLGLANGDLFPRIVACSPGFIARAPAQGHPRVFVSHGTADQILSIDRCSRVIVPRMRAAGYDVTYEEFEGRHELPPEIAADALRWMTG